MRPEQMHVPHPEGRREPNDPCERLHIVTDDRRRQRRLQSGGDRGLNTGHDPREAPRAANRVVDLFSWAVEAHLDPQSGGWELGTRNWGFTRRRRGRAGQVGEPGQPLTFEQRAVRQNDQLAPVRLHDAGAQIEDVRARQRLTTREKETLDAKRHRLVDRVVEPVRLQSLPAIGTGRHEAMFARQIAEVVHLNPQLV